MAETFSWPRLAVKAEAVLAAVVLVAALVMAELAKEAEKEAKAVAVLAVAQAAECSPDRAALAAKVAEPKAVRSEVPEAKAEKAAKAEPEMAR